MNRKQLGFLIGSAFVLLIVGSGLGAAFYATFFDTKYIYVESDQLPTTFSRYENTPHAIPPAIETPMAPSADHQPPSFVTAAAKARPAVVHIKSKYEASKTKREGDFFSNPFRDFFNDDLPDTPQGIASGSGVIISADGYIATNNHVIEDAASVEVTLFDNRTYEATIVGTDITTDLALLKIKGESLPNLAFTASEEVQVGQWVLAVGNPMDLTSTVTAGIVSAKGRNINLLRADTDLAIESFIQTDAAVNKGNSGGALVNMDGNLIGINTAIASRTGYYAGYSFAIPSSIVRKVMDDLLTYGEVRRGYLGVNIRQVDAQLAEDYDLEVLKGAFVANVSSNSGAEEAGIRRNDVIVSVNGIEVNSSSELQEQVSRFHPGDQILIKAYRGSKLLTFNVTLKDLAVRRAVREPIEAETPKVEEDPQKTTYRGSSFGNLGLDELDSFGLDYGIQVLSADETLTRNGIRDGFIITHVDGREIKSLDDLVDAFDQASEYITIKGQYSKGMSASYSFSW
ncbi:MAG: trypsin-like peptidase domain-containing protein [Bacteroidota bacterium]